MGVTLKKVTHVDKSLASWKGIHRRAKRPLRIPTDDEYKAYDGAHCARLWESLSETWRCPGCLRSKREIMRWTKRKARPDLGITKDYFGWMAGLHRPYDLSYSQFSETVICDHCNMAGGSAKRKLGLPENFSFSPAEIRRFVKPKPHQGHTIEIELALQIYLSSL